MKSYVGLGLGGSPGKSFCLYGGHPTPNLVLSGVFIEPSLHRHDSLNHWSLVIKTLSSLQRSGIGTFSSNTLITHGWGPTTNPPILRCFSKAASLSITKGSFISSSPYRKFQGFLEALFQGQQDKDQM